MKIDLGKCTEEELWKYIATELAKFDVDVILVGGAVVSIYSDGAYKSGDLDFVINDFCRDKLTEVLAGLEFYQKGRHFRNDKCEHLFLEFVTFPASIGEDYNIRPSEVENEGQVIKIFSPTDCVRDRLASYAFFKARECLDQSVLVCERQNINFEKIEKWCISENIEYAYKDLVEALKRKEK